MTTAEKLVRHQQFQQPIQLDNQWLEQAIDRVIRKIDQNMDWLGEGFPSASAEKGAYRVVQGEEADWTEGFWTGMLWLAYEVTKDEKYRHLAEKHVAVFKDRIDQQFKTNTHDLGFLYTLSCVSAYKLTGNEQAKEAALLAADLLTKRYHPAAKIIQAWGDLNNPEEQGRMIIDCNLNLPLLYWAHQVTGEQKYYDVAYEHIQQAAQYIVRSDSSTFHTYYMDVKTGEPVIGKTHQGYNDDSCWSRGQAWAIYGFALNYGHTKDERFFDISEKTAAYFLNRLPEDLVCYWDLIFTEGAEQERDSSGAAIAVCGLLELVKHIPLSNPNATLFKHAAFLIMQSLEENYKTSESELEHGILHHSVYNKGRGIGIDESCLWGDYYYFEALVRLYKPWNMYW